ncbi:MAG: hypothetical protein IKM46_03345 [Clostridia bacterium]|nr:hypothetical protein [Clostridia bacterium]
MKKLLIILIILIVTAFCVSSCQGGHPHTSPSANSNGNSSSPEETCKKTTPPRLADYSSKDMSYTVTVEDSSRTVTLDVIREGAVTTADVTSPESLAGMSLIYDAAGLRLRPPYDGCDELPVSDDAAAGLCIIFDIMKTTPDRDSFTADGYFRVTLRGISSKLFFSRDGFPSKLILEEAGNERTVHFTNIKQN